MMLKRNYATQELFMYDHDGQGRRSIVLPSDIRPIGLSVTLNRAVSPNGQWLAFHTGSIAISGEEEKLPLSLYVFSMKDGTTKKVSDLVAQGYQQKIEEVASNLKILFPDFYKPLDDRDWVSGRVDAEFKWGIYSLAWSPDSRYLAFAGQIDGISSDVYLYDIESEMIQRMSDDLQSVSWIEWSPDGEYIVYRNSIPGYVYTGASLHVLKPGAQTIKDPRVLQSSTWWSEKGWLSPEQLLISEGTDTAGDWDLKILNIKNGQVRHLWEDSFGNSAVDHENQVILLNSSDFTEPENMGVHIVTFDGKHEKILDGLNYFNLIFRGGEKHRFLASGIRISGGKEENSVLGIGLDGTITLLSEIRDRNISISPDHSRMLIYNDQEIDLYDENDEFVQTFFIPNVYAVLWRPDSQGVFYSTSKELYYLSFPDRMPVLVDKCVAESCGFVLSDRDSIWTQ